MILNVKKNIIIYKEDKTEITSINKDKIEIEQEDYMEELIESNFIGYKKEYDSTKKQIWWPKNVAYVGKKYSSDAKKSELICPSKNEIIYICTNHKINIINKKLKFKNNPCAGKLKYNRTTN